MDRRDFIKKGGAVVAGGLLADLGIFESAASAAAKVDRRPNIVFILVDEMRFPTAFPNGVHTPEQFLRRFMPNVFELYRHGVKFESYYSAGNACSPARATLATGLYPHQEWLLATRTAAGPALQPAFPTYGKLLKVDLLANPNAAGRDHVLFATDEILPNAMNYLHAPTHVLAVRTPEVKLVTYSHWAKGTTTPIRATMKLEFYDYASPDGRSELKSNPNDPRVKPLVNKLFNQYSPTQMEAPLPGTLKATVKRARASYLVFQAVTNAYTFKQLVLDPDQKLRTVLGYGGPF